MQVGMKWKQTNSQHKCSYWMSGTMVLVTLMSVASLQAQSFHEPIVLPHPDNPRSDIVWYADFENLENLDDGTHADRDVWQDNGNLLPEFNPAFVLKVDPEEAAVGRGYVEGSPVPTSTGSGYMTANIPGGPYQAINYRFYVRFSDEYMTYWGAPHGPRLNGVGDRGRSRGLTIELSAEGYYIYSTATTKSGSVDLRPFLPVGERPKFQNGRWYCVELQAIMDTQVTDPTDAKNGGNGIVRMWIDEQLVIEETSLNLGGVTDNLRWNSIMGPREYYHARIPLFGQSIYYDNFIISNNGTYIGPAQNENPRGVADPKSPYANYVGIEPFFGHHPAGDCSSGSAYLKTNLGRKYGLGATKQTEIVYDGTPNLCPHKQDTPEQAVKVELPNGDTRGGIEWEKYPGALTQQVINGWIYLPSGNDYSQHPSLVGFRGYSNFKHGKHVALTVADGKFGINQRREGRFDAELVLTSRRDVKFDQWQQFEIILWDDQTVSLMIDRDWAFHRKPLPHTVDWMFIPRHSSRALTVGVIDYQGTGPFTVYYDELQIGSASFWTCNGWSPTSSPFRRQSGLDLNMDGEVSIAGDFRLLYWWYLTEDASKPLADYNCDGRLNYRDLRWWYIDYRRWLINRNN